MNPSDGGGGAAHGRGKVTVAELGDYPDRLDVRSPAEFADDHIPGAVSLPVLDDAQRAEVGTLHAQVSAFAAKRRGAALVTRNIARILETHCATQPREWRPLVYCWRGGKRSGALAHILSEIGWRAVQLDGGYRAYRRHVITTLETLPSRFSFHVICGLTGTGKSRLLQALADENAQVLDLEELARHRGSLLGDLPGDPQPSQRRFDSELLARLQRFDALQPVFVEAESRKVGTVQLPDALLDAMRASTCIEVAMDRPSRVLLLKEEYAHFLRDPALLAARLAPLAQLYGNETIARWNTAGLAGDFDVLIDELLRRHYDPIYARSTQRNFPRFTDAIRVAPAGIDDESFRAVARDLAQRVNTPSSPLSMEFPT